MSFSLFAKSPDDSFALTFWLICLSSVSLASAFEATTAFHVGDFLQQLGDLAVSGLWASVESTRLHSVLDVGSRAVFGMSVATLRLLPDGWAYVGVDVDEGSSVDIVLEDPYVFPFADGRFSAVVSVDAFEHIDFFWLTFVEMLRVCVQGGYIMIALPDQSTAYHTDADKFVRDSWRWTHNASNALQNWAVRNGYSDLCLLYNFESGNSRFVVFQRAACATYSYRVLRLWPSVPPAGIILQAVLDSCWNGFKLPLKMVTKCCLQSPVVSMTQGCFDARNGFAQCCVPNRRYIPYARHIARLSAPHNWTSTPWGS